MQQFHTVPHKESNMKRVETCMHNKCMTVEIIPKTVERAEGQLFIVVSGRKVLIIDGLACMYFT